MRNLTLNRIVKSVRLAFGVAATGALMVASASQAQVPRCLGEKHLACEYYHYYYDVFGDPAISGNWAVIGKRGDDEIEDESGAVYMYEFSYGEWQEHSKLKADNPEEGERLGESVTMDGDIAVGAASWWNNSRGRLIVFNREVDPYSGESEWVQDAVLTVSSAQAGDRLGGDFAIRECIDMHGDLIVAGAPRAAGSTGTPSTNSGYVAVFRHTTQGWVEEAILRPRDYGQSNTDGNFGAAVAVHGNRIVVGEPNRNNGQVYVFTYNPSSPSPNPCVLDQILWPSIWSPTDDFGYAVDASEDLIAVGAPGDDKAYIYRHNGTSWNVFWELDAPANVAEFGHSISLSGDNVLVGDPGYLTFQNETHGGAFLYELLQNNQADHVLTLVPKVLQTGLPPKRFGHAMSLDGTEAIIGAIRILGDSYGNTNIGAAYFYSDLPNCDSYDPECAPY